MKKIIAIFMLTIMMLPAAAALGIAPARKNIEYAPNSAQTLTYRIYNSDRQDFTATITLTDGLEEIATVKPEKIQFTKDETVKEFDVEINFGRQLPAKLTGKIVVTGQTQGGMVAAAVEISSSLSIIATGNTVAEIEDIPLEKDNSLMRYAVMALVVIVGVANIVFFVLNRRLKNKSSPIVREEDHPLSPTQSHIEEEIERLRKMM